MSSVALARQAPTFSERVLNLLDKVDYRLATTEEERDAIYRLRYDAYVREGSIAPNFGRRLSDKYDDLDNAWVFGIFVEGRLASSIRLHISSPANPEMPATSVFADLLDPMVAAGQTIIDPTRFVVARDAAEKYPELPYVTVRVGWMAGEFFSADAILATVRAEHQAFYRRMFGHEILAAPREYPSLTKPISLMSLDFFRMKDRVHYRYPFFRSTAFERRMLFGGAGMPAVWASEGGESIETEQKSALAG